MRKQLQSQNLFKIPVPVCVFFVKNENNSLCPRLRLAAIFFNQPRGNSLGARLNFIIMLIYALFQNFQGKNALYFIRFISAEKWVGCKHFKSYIFEVFADKHGQVASDSVTRSHRSSGGSRLLMKALVKSQPGKILVKM